MSAQYLGPFSGTNSLTVSGTGSCTRAYPDAHPVMSKAAAAEPERDARDGARRKTRSAESSNHCTAHTFVCYVQHLGILVVAVQVEVRIFVLCELNVRRQPVNGRSSLTVHETQTTIG